jgi:NAD(P)-dependent dehydrogenase (short-subunit alcohol dehydrogenase family)
MGRFDGRTVAVVGAAGGIGAAASRALVRDGARVALIDRAAEAVEALATSLAGDGGETLALVADVTRENEVEAAFAAVVRRWERLDGLFHVAGGSGRGQGDGPVDSCTLAGWEAVLANNLTSVFLSNRAAIRAMLGQGGGAIVNTSSVLGMVGAGADFATHAYAAAKGGIIALTRAEAVHYAPQGIRVNCVAPGLIRTAMSRRAQHAPGIVASMRWRQPIAGDLGEPEDVAAAALYLLSEEASLVTGVVLPVDGGWTAQ